ncbi:hypothetical protein SMF913_10074 [Streptomyces malaysiensis]|uniref:Uncharacterized protein n=1 Tax=Streptomyces malaysiensis TaxID=92644 RepID=A0A2J7Z1J7_STRMQ|nr:hypothetical protein SMF913_10074 [Streptomyces malaysiensis]
MSRDRLLVTNSQMYTYLVLAGGGDGLLIGERVVVDLVAAPGPTADQPSRWSGETVGDCGPRVRATASSTSSVRVLWGSGADEAASVVADLGEHAGSEQGPRPGSERDAPFRRTGVRLSSYRCPTEG